MYKRHRIFRRAVAGTTGVAFALLQLVTMSTVAHAAPATPIKHLVVIFQENISFDHYFGTYPNALNPQQEPAFHALASTPSVNGLSGILLTNNPNLNPANNVAENN